MIQWKEAPIPNQAGKPGREETQAQDRSRKKSKSNSSPWSHNGGQKMISSDFQKAKSAKKGFSSHHWSLHVKSTTCRSMDNPAAKPYGCKSFARGKVVGCLIVCGLACSEAN